ncbi:MAG TPA: histidine--tRNA ligase [Spirochaetota bacterium]|nr:histidine--tRNA ligase [Spirochaetota bacterium]HOD14328.1 histidine--tRNA ligase [Spirochaetota bacterium]HPG51425.1 histidine--tRNA ligase [Spirochaetota bacterium]HPN12569.1 histidine--tRNA ligase [Spirochaetota bacterium]HQL83468.1 histidine--tRNA ligase [Spirochaetota bacterium]
MISRPPGIEDIFPDRIGRRNRILGAAREVFALYNFREIVIPVMEFTDVFVRGLGTETDIVTKEMFTFEDRGGRSLTLRPEGTASVVRAYVENGEYNRLSACKLFYAGPMFRAERPQKGRLRQFNQFGAEFFGSDDPYYDFEVIAMMDDIARRSGITGFTLLVNSIGCPACRPAFIADLKKYYAGRADSLCKDCGGRLDRNPLRLLDCKQESCKSLKKDAPRITDFLCEGCRAHHAAVKGYLSGAHIAYTEDHLLVRGLDYYTRTTFEFVTDRLGGQNAFAAGGRYDNLVAEFGGRPTPAVGFAAGVERMELLLEGADIPGDGIDAFIAHTGGAALERAVSLVRELRAAGLSADLDPATKGFKAQFKKADREGASFVLVIGEDEISAGTCTVKALESGAQETVPAHSVAAYLRNRLGR